MDKKCWAVEIQMALNSAALWFFVKLYGQLLFCVNEFSWPFKLTNVGVTAA